MNEKRGAPLDPLTSLLSSTSAQPRRLNPNPLRSPPTLIAQTCPDVHTHHAQVTPEPVPLRGLRETSEAARVVIGGVGPGQEADQEPGGSQQQQE